MGFFAGRRVGKTDTFFNRCVKRCLSGPVEYVYIAPSYALAKEQFERISESLKPFTIKNGARAQPVPEIILYNGSRIRFRSFDRPKLLRGLRAIDEIWVDEIQDIKEAPFWSVLRPILSDRRGTLVVSGQFRGLNWYYKQFYEAGQQPNQSLYWSCKKPSSSGLMFQDEEGRQELEIARSQLPRAVFLQEYECEPVANQAAVFLTEDLQVIKRGKPLQKPERDRHYIIGYDLGEMTDPSSACVLEYETGSVVHSEKVPIRTKHSIQAKALAENARRWNNAQVIIDGTAGGTGGKRSADETVKYYRELIPDVRVMIWEPSVKAELVRRSSLVIENHEISIPPEFSLLHEELASYEFERKGETYIYHGADGCHDDQVAALMMAIYGWKSGWIKDRNAIPLGRLLH
jgi:hypothetical protein